MNFELNLLEVYLDHVVKKENTIIKAVKYLQRTGGHARWMFVRRE